MSLVERPILPLLLFGSIWLIHAGLWYLALYFWAKDGSYRQDKQAFAKVYKDAAYYDLIIFIIMDVIIFLKRIVRYISTEYVRSMIWDYCFKSSIVFHTYDTVTVSKRLNTFVAERQWNELIEAIRQETIIKNNKGAPSTRATIRLPVSLLIQALERGAPATVIRTILAACPGLAGQCERVTLLANNHGRYINRYPNEPSELKGVRYPIHVACEMLNTNIKDSFDILQALIKDFPKGLLKSNVIGRLPIHIILYRHILLLICISENLFQNITQMLLDANPKCLEYMDDKKVLPVHVVLTHIFPSVGRSSMKPKKILVDTAIKMIRMYPESVQYAPGCYYSNDPLYQIVYNVRDSMYWNNIDIGRLFHVFIEAYSNSAKEKIESKEATFFFELLDESTKHNNGGGTVLHLLCSFSYTKDTPPCEEFMKAIYSLIKSCPKLIETKDDDGQFPIQRLLVVSKTRRNYVPLELIKLLVELYPKVLYMNGYCMKPYASYDITKERKHRPNLLYYILMHVETNGFHRRDYCRHHLEGGTSNNNDVVNHDIINRNNNNDKNENEQSWINTIDFLLSKTHMIDSPFGSSSRTNNIDHDGTVNFQNVPIFHRILLYGPPLYVAEKLLHYYPSNILGTTDQFGMLPLHYACLDSYSSSPSLSVKKYYELEQLNVIHKLLLHYPNALLVH